MPEREIMWTGEPICYRREEGSALVVGRYHYLFDVEGRMTAMQPITRPVLAVLLQALYKDTALAMAAHVLTIPLPPSAEDQAIQEATLQQAQEQQMQSNLGGKQ